jgi:hypothetical protein
LLLLNIRENCKEVILLLLLVKSSFSKHKMALVKPVVKDVVFVIILILAMSALKVLRFIIVIGKMHRFASIAFGMNA